jgi:hypothetical protein
MLAQFSNQPDDIVLANPPAVDLDPFAERNQVRRGEQPDAQAGRAINAFQHGAGRALAIGAGDVDETEPVLRLARQRGELERIFQPQLRAEQTQVKEKLDGFRISHGGNFEDYRSMVKVMS